LGGGQHPRGDVDRDPADVVLAQLDLAGVQPGTKLDPDAGKLVGRVAARRMARPGPSKVARIPSPVVFTSRPSNSPTRRAASSSCTSSSWRQRRSPSRPARSVEATMSVNSTVASTRLGSGRRWTPVENS
jgi:hypothetical protein